MAYDMYRDEYVYGTERIPRAGSLGRWDVLGRISDAFQAYYAAALPLPNRLQVPFEDLYDLRIAGVVGDSYRGCQLSVGPELRVWFEPEPFYELQARAHYGERR